MENFKYCILLSRGGGGLLYCKNKCQRKLVPAVVSRTRMELHQNFLQSLVGNELQVPEMGKIPFFSGHTALSSISIHLACCHYSLLDCDLGSLRSCVGFFPVTSVLAQSFDQHMLTKSTDTHHHS